MAMNRIQFQPGLSLTGFLQQYGTEAACTRALRRARWPKGFVCPRCGGRRYGRCANRHGERMWQCSACRHQTTLLSGTLFEATKLPLRTLATKTWKKYSPKLLRQLLRSTQKRQPASLHDHLYVHLDTYIHTKSK